MKKAFKIIMISLITLVIVACTFFLYVSRDTTNATTENIDQILREAAELNRFGGFAVSVFSPDSIYFSGGFGYQDVEKKIPYTKKTIQRIGSVAKTTIGIALLKAQEMALLKLTDPVNEHLPFKVSNPHFPNIPITIEHLATHTSSMGYNEPVVESLYVKDRNKKESLKDFMDSYFLEAGALYATDYYLEQKPGAYFDYANIPSALAAYIIEYRSGMTFDAFTKAHIFEPLGLKHTGWFAKNLDNNLIATNYVMDEERKLQKSEKEGISLYPVGDMMTNIDELTKYCQSIISQGQNDELALLKPSSYQSMLSNKLSDEVVNQAYKAQGIFNYVNMNIEGIPLNLKGHAGGDDCLYANMFFDPKTNMGYVFMANTGKAGGNHGMRIFIHQTLHSLGKNILKEEKKGSPTDYIAYAWHDASSRIMAPFD